MTSKAKREWTSKLPNTGSSIFSEMSALAQKHQAINLSQGFPDYAIDSKLINLVNKAMHDGANQYAPMPGLPALRQRIAEKYQSFYDVKVDAENEITITSGTTQAIFTTIATIIRPDDEIIIFEPAYDCYRPTVELFGGKVVPVSLYAPSFQIDWNTVEQLITERTRLIIINNPGNPSCTTLSSDDLFQLQRIATENELFVLSDEVYEHLIYDEHKHQSALLFEELRQRSFVIASFGKLLHCTGWKMGYVVAPQKLTTEFRKVHQQNVFSVSTPMQHAIANYLDDASYYNKLSQFMQRKRDLVLEGLRHSRFNMQPSAGTYFLLLDYSLISEKSGKDFALELIEQHGVALIPLSPFYNERTEQKMLRLCFAKEDNTLNKAIKILNKL